MQAMEVGVVLEGRKAIVYGGSGAIGSAAARAFAAAGAHVCLVGRNRDRLDAVRDGITAAGGGCEAAALDVFDAEAVRDHAARFADEHGGIDIVLNAVSLMHDQGVPLADLSLEAFMRPIDGFLGALFNATRAVAPHMGGRNPGVILTLSTPAARMAPAGHLGYGVTCAGVEAFSRLLAEELAYRNTRVVCVRPHAISDAPEAGSYTAALFGPKAAAMGMTVEAWLQGAAAGTMRGKLPTLAEVAGACVFLASPHADSMTGTVFNLTAGAQVD